MAEGFLTRSAAQHNAPPKVLSTEALDACMAYSWPGNVRELENALERAVILAPGGEIPVEALPARITERRAEPLVSARTPSTPTTPSA